MACLASSVAAQQHDHSDWNMVGVGRMVALARIDPDACRAGQGGILECSTAASEVAVGKLESLMELFGCRVIGAQKSPAIDTYGPLTEYDHGPIVIAELDDVHCSLSPRRQLFPVSPEEFAVLCSALEWKCDAVWISDGDESVWHINNTSDLRR
jgi:hypothetical protein